MVFSSAEILKRSRTRFENRRLVRCQEFLGIKAKLELILIVDHALVSICNAIEDAVLTSDSRNNKLLKRIYDAYKFRNRTDIAEAKERID